MGLLTASTGKIFYEHDVETEVKKNALAEALNKDRNFGEEENCNEGASHKNETYTATRKKLAEERGIDVKSGRIMNRKKNAC